MVSSASDTPVIGLTTYVETAQQGVWNVPAAYLQQDYLHAVEHAGGLAVLLPQQPLSEGVAERVISRVDALVLTGGKDVESVHYGEERHETADDPRPERDAWEFALFRAALDRGVPVLGICRGAQVINVALGGSLVQHLPDALGEDTHRGDPGVFVPNDVRAEPGSLLASIFGDHVVATCYHHQAIGRLAADLRVSGRTADEVIEAVEMPGRPFVLAVQWHPEATYEDARLMSALVDAARRYAASTTPQMQEFT